MKITTVDDAIEEFRNCRDTWSRNHVELFIREINRLKRLIEKKNDALESYSNFYDELLSAIGRSAGTNHCTETDQMILDILKGKTS